MGAVDRQPIMFVLWTLFLQTIIVFGGTPFLLKPYPTRQNASEDLYRLEWARISDPSTLPQGIQMVDRLLESYFGDALCSRRTCHGVTTYEENYSRDIMDPSQVKPNQPAETYWTNAGKARLFPLYQTNKVSRGEDDEEEETAAIVLNLNLSKKYNLSDIFDMSLSNSHKDEMVAIQMNFAGGKPVPQEQLVRRCVDKDHSQFIGPSLYAITNYEAGCTGPRIIVPKRSRPRSKSNITPSNEELLFVL